MHSDAKTGVAPPHSALGEHQHHDYRSSRIPWYVHVIWISFWVVAIIYIFRYLVPSMQVELANPP
jgi:hypothetical protein